MSAVSDLLALEAAYNQGSANRRDGTQYPAAPQTAPNANIPKPNPLRDVPTDNGSYRQPPSNIPRELPTRDRPVSPPTQPKPSTTTSPSNVPQSLKDRLGNVANRAGNLGNKVGNNAGLAAGALAVGSSLNNLRQSPTLSNAAAAAGGLLLLVPNPYAQGLGLALSILSPILNMFEPPQNIKGNPDIIPAPFTGGQQIDIYYDIAVVSNVTVPNYPYPTISTDRYRGLLGKITAVDIGQQNNGQGTLFAFATIRNNSSYGVGSVRLNLNFGYLPNWQFSIASISITRSDRQLDTGGDPLTGTEGLPEYVPAANQDGFAPPDFDALRERLDGIEDAIKTRNLSDSQKDDLLNAIKQLLPQANNNVTPQAPDRTPQPLLAPSPSSPTISPATPSGAGMGAVGLDLSKGFNSIQNPSDPNGEPIDLYTRLPYSKFRESIDAKAMEPAIKAASFDAKENEKQFSNLSQIIDPKTGKSPQQTAREDYQKLISNDKIKLDSYQKFAPKAIDKTDTPTRLNNVTPSPSTVPSSLTKLSTSLKPELDRFKEKTGTDCKFSCEELAKCFVDLKVQIFDGCDPKTGGAKTKDITIQVLPKDKLKTSSIFQEFLDIRSKECTLNDKILTVPEYWQVRVGQRSQAVILYREFKDGKFTTSCYSLHIPHYTGNKNTKPNLSQYNKGESSAIYICKDNSKLVVYASNEQEAKRIINQMEKYIDPKMRGSIVKFGTRKGIKETTVKPIRLDFFSTGQTKLSPDWSIAL